MSVENIPWDQLGEIVIHTDRSNLDDLPETHRYEWQGGDWVRLRPRSLINVGYAAEDWRPGQRVSIGPFRLRLITYDHVMRVWFAKRGPRWETWLRWRLHLATRWADRIYRRCILTAAIWGLARANAYTIPCWRDVFLLSRIERAVKGWRP